MTQTFLFLQPRDTEQIPNATDVATFVLNSAHVQQRLSRRNGCLQLIPADVLHFPRLKFKNPEIAVANALGMDAEGGQSGSPSPCQTPLTPGQTPRKYTFPCR